MPIQPFPRPEHPFLSYPLSDSEALCPEIDQYQGGIGGYALFWCDIPLGASSPEIQGFFAPGISAAFWCAA